VAHAIENKFICENLAINLEGKSLFNISGFIWSPGARCGAVG